MTDRRFFTQEQRNEIYRSAGGHCQECGTKLIGDSWHADHYTPVWADGETTVDNGRALCPKCNLKKGIRLPDNILLRPFQRELTDVVRARIAAGEHVTVALVGAGSGKTLAYLYLTNALYRDGLIDALSGYVPRKNLRRQAALDCNDLRSKSASPCMGEIIERGNVEPLVPADKFGFVANYQSLVSDSKKDDDKQLHLNWAKENAGRFILILDEAQFLGIADDDGGTQAAAQVEQIAEYALHVVVLSATPVRSDKRPLIFCEYSEPNEKGLRMLKWHVRATYREGVALKYLRPCEFHLNNGNGSFTNGETFEVEELERRLSTVLRSNDIWQPLVDETIRQFRFCRRLCKEYRSLIACIDQDHAKKVYEYIKKKYPEFVTVIAISDDTDSRNVLDAFRPVDKGGSNSGDILVSVAMAYIGFDCAPIIVVGNLTNKRWFGWLEQLIMRGGRMWSGQPVDGQTLIVVAPNDPLMAAFARKFRADAEAGLRDRGTGGDFPPPSLDDVDVEKAELTDAVCLGLSIDQDLTAEEFAGLSEFQKTLDGHVNITTLGEIFRKAGKEIPKTGARAKANQKTWAERHKDFSAKVQARLIKLIAVRYNVRSRDDRAAFQKHIARLTSELNKQQNVKDSNHLTEDQWNERIRRLDTWIGEGAADE